MHPALRRAMTQRVYNFGPGPAMFPTPVMERAREEFLDFRGMGASVIEISHRSPTFEGLLGETDALLTGLMGIPAGYRICYVHGGAQMQFSAVPLNLMGRGRRRRAHYFDTGNFAGRAIAEARRYGEVNVAGSSAATNHDRIPEAPPGGLDGEAAYVHLTSNNTIYGTQWHHLPETDGLPLVADMTSDILSRPVDVSRYGIIYAGAQKNLGTAGMAVVIVREDLLGHALPGTPLLLDYATYARDHSLTNTPNVFSIYTTWLVLQWLRESGGVPAMERQNRQKAGRLYGLIDRSGFYRGFARPAHRSLMNVAFDVPSAELRDRFLAEALDAGLYALKGHRALGGLRASIYNAMPAEGVEALAQFMEDFERRYG